MIRRYLMMLSVTVAMMPVMASELAENSKPVDTTLKSAGPLTFGPNGVLFVADPMAATIHAIETGDKSGDIKAVNVEDLGSKLADMLGAEPKDVSVQDLAVNPASGNIYLSVRRGQGPKATAVLFKVTSSGKLEALDLDDVKSTQATLTNAPKDQIVGSGRRSRNPRTESITDLAYVDGRVFVAGLSNEEFASKLRSIPFPFKKTDAGTSVEIYHGAHGKFETRSPVRTFTPFMVDGEAQLLAAYTCTPLVRFSVSQLEPGAKIRGTTIAELGNRNRPLDMVVYKKQGKSYILIANNARGIMKVTTEGLGSIKGITKRISGTAGLSYETIEDWKGIEQLDKLGDGQAVVAMRDARGGLHLKSLDLP